MTNIQDADTEVIVDLIAGSDANLALAVERFDKKHGNKFGTTNGYDIAERIASFDIQSADNLAAKLRVLLTVRLYALIHEFTIQLSLVMGDLKPAELARTHTS